MSTLQNTTRIGDEFEKRIFEFFRTEIDADRLPFKRECCKIFSKKGYYSRDRCSEIVFDIAIELYFPGAQEYSMLLLVECKRYSHAVPVDDVEEFFVKVQQVGAANTKAVVVSTAAFQRGALEFSKAKGIGLARYFGPENFKWELRRSPSTTVRRNADSNENVELGLFDETFKSPSFDFYFQSSKRLTNSLWEFIDDAFSDLTSAPGVAMGELKNLRRDLEEVAFMEKGAIEEMGASILSRIGYADGEVELQEICRLEAERTGLQLRLNHPVVNSGAGQEALGRITFDPLIIDVYAQQDPNRGRERFTLAHEMAHYFLDHGRYLVSESCDSDDFVLHRTGLNDVAISRLEFQANYMASSVLLPRAQVIADFNRLLQVIGLSDKGFGSLYVDDQPCNIQNYDFITGRLMQKYGVSRSAVRIRLETLDLLRDNRRQVVMGKMLNR
ncbi:ImmA/IrrE family metallo-endopeptidase [Burkholderia anthina]|uniref:ImmA/IrrE family metallo-endopeptidase n=1 Tax=Burkholderia anthina TaxID=179879 RepID=UPI00158EEF3D